MKLVFNCHTEYDLKNQAGSAKELPADQQTFSHLPALLTWFNSLNLPMTFSLAVGGPIKDRLLQYIKDKQLKFPCLAELAIHFHSEEFLAGQWQFKGFLKESEYSQYLGQFEQVFDFLPKTTVFGKWQIDKSAFNFLSRQGIKKDGSFVDMEKIIRQPFEMGNILEIPVNSFKGEPINPFSRLSHFFLLKKIIKKHHQENLLLQIGFHSYDFFRFGQPPRLRWIKKIIFKNLLKLIKQNQVEIIALKEIEKDNFGDLEKVKMSFLGKLFNFLGH